MPLFRLLCLIALLGALAAAEGKAKKKPDPSEWPSLEGRTLTIALLDKGRPVERLDAAIANGQLTSKWIAKQGFASPLPMGAPKLDGMNNKTTSYGITATNDKGDQLSITISVYDARNGGNLGGSLSVVRADGSVRNYGLLANGVITADPAEAKEGGKEKGAGEKTGKEKKKDG